MICLESGVQLEKEKELKALTVMLKASGTVEKCLKRDILEYHLNPTEFSVMELLYSKGKQPIQIIGKKVLIASSSITYVIDKLEEKDFVERIPNAKDRRVTLVQLTEKGLRKMDESFSMHKESIAKLFKQFDANELKQFIDLSKKIGYTAQELLDQQSK